MAESMDVDFSYRVGKSNLISKKKLIKSKFFEYRE